MSEKSELFLVFCLIVIVFVLTGVLFAYFEIRPQEADFYRANYVCGSINSTLIASYDHNRRNNLPMRAECADGSIFDIGRTPKNTRIIEGNPFTKQ